MLDNYMIFDQSANIFVPLPSTNRSACCQNRAVCLKIHLASGKTQGHFVLGLTGREERGAVGFQCSELKREAYPPPDIAGIGENGDETAQAYRVITLPPDNHKKLAK